MENTILTNILKRQDVLRSTLWLVRSACVGGAYRTPMGKAIHLFWDQTNSALVRAFTIKKGIAWNIADSVHRKERNAFAVKMSNRSDPTAKAVVPMVDIPTVEVAARLHQ